MLSIKNINCILLGSYIVTEKETFALPLCNQLEPPEFYLLNADVLAQMVFLFMFQNPLMILAISHYRNHNATYLI